MNNASKFLIALAAALAMPAAFAQDATTAEQDSTQAAPPTQQAQPAEQAQPQTTWADLDADKDGSLSKTEAAGVPALAADFDKADANGDGKLSPDEYRAFAAAKNGDTQAPK